MGRKALAIIQAMILLLGVTTLCSGADRGAWPVRRLESANNVIEVNGRLDELAWSLPGRIDLQGDNALHHSVKYGALWDDSFLYIGVTFQRSTDGDGDTVEIYIRDNQSVGPDKGRVYRVTVGDDQTDNDSQGTSGSIIRCSLSSNGYTIEAAIPWSDLGILPKPGSTVLGFDIALNHDDQRVMLASANAHSAFPNLSNLNLLKLSATYGDRHPDVKMVYPDAVKRSDGYVGSDKRVIDVTKPPFNAVPDDGLDDTEAIVSAYEFVLNELHAGGWVGNGGVPANLNKSYTIYFPNGVYNVSDTIIYREPDRPHPNLAVDEELAMVRFVGESREGVVIKLSDNNPRFQDPDHPRPVLSFGKRDFNNLVSSNSVRSLTVDAGDHNPGAIGIKFGGANINDIYNISIVAGSDSGFVGLDNAIGTVVGYQSNITVRGFRYGIRLLPFHFTYPTMEYITLTQQREAGILFVNGMGAVRNLWSDNQAPAILVSEGGSHAVVLDSTFVNNDGDMTTPAVDVLKGHLFARNVQVHGYSLGVRKNGQPVVTSDIDEYVSDSVVKFSDTMPDASMNLPIKEVPPMPWEADLAKWANVDEYPGTNDAQKIQNAMNDQTKTVVYFPRGMYDIDATIKVPPHIKMINFLHGEIGGAIGTRFQTIGESDKPLWIMDGTFTGAGVGANIVQGSNRAVVLHHIRGRGGSVYSNSYTGADGVDTFANAVTGIKPPTMLSNQRAWFRFVNTEHKELPNFAVDSNAVVWVMGYKTEGSVQNFSVNPGGTLEIVGGFGNMWTSHPFTDTPAYENHNGHISIVAATNGQSKPGAAMYDRFFRNIIQDTTDDKTRVFTWDQLPKREHPDYPDSGHSVVIPLYVNYDFEQRREAHQQNASGDETTPSQRDVAASPATDVAPRMWELVDELEPPLEGWFSSVHLLKTTERSAGWIYATDRPQDYFNDSSRIRPAGTEPEHLVWDAPELRDYRVTVLVPTTDLKRNVTLAVSPDNKTWQVILPQVEAVEEAGRLIKLELTGMAPEGLSAAWFRIEVAGKDAETIHIGRVMLRGLKANP